MKLNRFLLPVCFPLSVLIPCLHVFNEPSEPQQNDAITPIGCFSNVRSDGEHADGYSLKLWFRGKKVIGIVEYHRGLAGDAPIGILKDVWYEPSTGELSFAAKLTSGVHFCRVHKNVPSHDLLHFDGTLTDDMLQGNIVLEDQLDAPPVVVDKRQDFLMLKIEGCFGENFRNYDAWWKYWEPVNKFRGPKW